MQKNLFILLIVLITACTTAEQPKKEILAVCTTKLIQPPIQIIDKPIKFGFKRIALTKKYIKSHYGKKVNNIKIIPKIIVLHWTANMDLKKSFNYLKPQLLSGRADIQKASALNVSSQFMVDRDGTIYRLMPENWMARHVIGLNYSSIGVENIGNDKYGLTKAQVIANIALVKYLKNRYSTIEYLIGHHEYRRMENTPLWLEIDKGYRTTKTDPGDKFMKSVRDEVKELKLKTAPSSR